MRVASLGVVVVLAVFAMGAGPLVNLDTDSPYYPNRNYPKLTTPQWVGEDGVEAVVILAIDDMRDQKRYEAFLRPILDRLKKIDGRAPVSIMTCKIDPATPALQDWLKEGLSFEVHTVEHPCPILAAGDLARAKSTFDRCLDQIASIPGNSPVAFRTPCCDSLNTPSPRMFAEIFNKTSPGEHFLRIDSSVMNIISTNDPELPRELVLEKDGHERFRKYVPFESFVNTIDDYPYPYVIGGVCWEFPCATPSDWEAQYVRKQNASPATLADWKALLDVTVIKKGVMTTVFHPYGWSAPEQWVEFIDYAQAKYGKKVKFLNFREAEERLTKNLLGGIPLRGKDGGDNGVRMMDLNGDGFLDVVIDNKTTGVSRVWLATDKKWVEARFPGDSSIGAGSFGALDKSGQMFHVGKNGFHRFDGTKWVADREKMEGLDDVAAALDIPRGAILVDLDGDGICELITSVSWVAGGIFRWDDQKKTWQKLPFDLPEGISITDPCWNDYGVRLIDINEDGHPDIVFSNEWASGLFLWESIEKGWSRKVFFGKRDAKSLPRIVREDMTNNGLWAHSRTLWWQNENTDKLKNLVDRRTFNELLSGMEPLARSPKASLASMKVAPGYQVELVATEPLVQDPIAFAFGADGKLWVVEMGDYPLGVDGKGKVGGRVKYLEDTDGDGVYDKVTIFLEDVPYPTSVLPWKKGVLIASAPDIFYAEDTDGDGKADKREVLFTGFKEGNQQHRLNHFSFGLDNWVYGANGDSGGNVKSMKTGKTVSISGRDFRFKPDTGEFEAVSGASQFALSRTDAGDWFGNNNSNPLWHFPLEEVYLKRNPHVPPAPGVLRVDVPEVAGASPVFAISPFQERYNDFHTANHFTSACAAHVYRDDLFPGVLNHEGAEARREEIQVFVSEPVHNLVHREIVSPVGSTFAGKRAPGEETAEFLASSDNWFRPTTVDTGPDGALYIADMYRQTIEHPQWIPKEAQAKLDLRLGHDMGRIYRVSPVGSKRRGIPRLDKLDTAGLVAALDSSNGWQRDMAQAMLVWRGDKEAVGLLEKVSSKNALARLHALCALDGLGALTTEKLAAAVKDEDAVVRRHAVRLAEGRLDVVTDARERSKLAVDEAHVRLQLACSLGTLDDPSAAVLLGEMLTDPGSDRYLIAAAMSSINSKNVAGVAAAITDAARRNPPAPEVLAGVLRTAVGTNQAKAIGDTLGTLTEAKGGKFEAWQFRTLANLLDSLEESKTPLAGFLGGAEGDASAKRVESVIVAARAALNDADAPLEARAAAVALLGRDAATRKDDLASLNRSLTPQSPRELQAAIIATLSRRREAEGAKMLLDHWKTFTPELRAAAVDGLLARAERANLLLDAVETKKVLVMEIDTPRRQRMLQYPDKVVRTRAEALFALTINADRQKVIDNFSAALTLNGDAKKGQLLFAKTCATCHRLGEIGNAVGPDLASVGDKSPQGLLIAILDPNRAVEPRYVNYIATTNDDQTLTGLLAAESATSITLLGPDAKQQVLRRQDLKDLRSSNTSLMPDGLEAGLKAEDLADLIAFVRAGK